MNAIEIAICDFGVVPVVVLNDASKASDLAAALERGGLPCAEVTFRTDAAEDSIRIIATEHPDMLVGAGTVLSVEQVQRAVAAGAKFIVAPGFDAEVVDYCIDHEIPVFPGCVTPTEVGQCAKRGLRIVKFFPAAQFGGVATIKAIAAPFTQMRFMPTGGVNRDNLRDYLECSKVAACGGSWMVKSALVDEGQFEKIEELAREAVAIVRDVRA